MLKNILLILELFLLVIFIIPVFSGILNPGNMLGILISSALFIITLFFERVKVFCTDVFSHTGGKILLCSVALFAAIGIVYTSVLSAFMLTAQFRTNEDAEAIIVLGCKVNGEKPSRMLARRLDSAYEFLAENENTICVVSGGKGDDEKISEALAMKRYLVDKGISSDRIIMEDKSVNTYENMKFSAQKLESYNISDVAIVTDGFHQYRAGYIAKKYGFTVSAVNAKNDFITRPLISTYWVREWLAITKEYALSLLKETP